MSALPRIAQPLATLLILGGVVWACGGDDADVGEPTRSVEAYLNAAERMARYTQIRDAAAGRGIDHTGYLLAGIAYSETNLAHCWSEATWACQGPNSPDCGNGPVIAGAADGPCSAQQGGLGMFQFDAGTFTDTLNTYGSDVLTVAGNTSHAIDYVINMVKISAYTTNAETDAKALQWVIDFDVNNGTLRDQWIKTVTRYYNGCQEGWSCWSQRYASYNAGLQTVIDETGLPFWIVAPPDQAPAGYLDSAGCDSITGWAQDPDTPADPIDVHLYFGGPSGSGAPGVSTQANVYRDDLCGAIGSCEHGFLLPTPLSLLDGQPHPVFAYGIGSNGSNNGELSGSQTELSCAATIPGGVRRHVIHPDSYAAWKLDAFHDRLPLAESDVKTLAQGMDVPAEPNLVQADDGSPEVWVVDGAFRRHVPGADVMTSWRFDWGSIQTKPAAEVYALEAGPAWRARPVEVAADGAIWLVDDPFPEEETQPDGGAAGSAGWQETGGGSGAAGAAGVAGGSGSTEGGATEGPGGAAWWDDNRESDSGCSLSASSPNTEYGWWLIGGLCAVLARRRRGRQTALPRCPESRTDFCRRFRRKTQMPSWPDDRVPNVAKAIESSATICGICGQFRCWFPRDFRCESRTHDSRGASLVPVPGDGNHYSCWGE